MKNHSVISTWRNYSDFRLLWISSLSTYIGRWMETAVGAWLVLQMTDSPFLVGLLGVCRFAPMMLGPFFGAISDRYHRRRILLTAQGMYGTASLFVGFLFLTAFLDVWHLFAYVLVGGICHTLDFSTRYAAAADIVNRKHLVAAISLLVGSLPESINKGKLLIAAAIAWPGFLMIFSISRLFPVSVTLLVLAGANQGIVMALIQSMMLMRASAEMRGRVIGARALAVATLPLGNLIAGAGADLLGAAVMLVIISSAAILMTFFLALRSPELLKGSETGN